MIAARPFTTFAPGGAFAGNRAYDAVPNARLVAWYDSLNPIISSVSGLGSGVNTITDLSGQISTLSGVSPNRPVYTASQFNAKPGIVFPIPATETDWLTTSARVLCPLGYSAFFTFKVDTGGGTDTSVTTTGNVPCTILGDTTTGFGNAFGLNGNNVSYSYKVAGSFGAVTSSGLSLADGNIHTIAVSHDASSAVVKLYADGVLVATSTKTYDPANTGFNTLGTGSAHTDQFYGAVSEGFVWNAAVSDSAVAAMHTRAVGLWGATAAGAAFDPTTLSLSGYWRASYSGSPWVGTASAGSSSGRDLTQSTFPPQTGTAVNGYTPANFDEANPDYLNTADNNNTLMSSTASSGWFLLKSTSVPTAFGDDYADGNLMSDNVNAETTVGHVSVGGTAKLVACFYASSYIRVELAMTANAWHLAQWKHDGVNLKIRVDNSGWSSVACGTLSFLTPSVLTTGLGYGGGTKLTGDVLEWAVSDTAISDANFDNVRTYCNSKYALSV